MLYICSEKYLPTPSEVAKDHHGNLMRTLSSIGGVFTAYSVAFLIIGHIWYTQVHIFKVRICATRFCHERCVIITVQIEISFLRTCTYTIHTRTEGSIFLETYTSPTACDITFEFLTRKL